MKISRRGFVRPVYRAVCATLLAALFTAPPSQAQTQQAQSAQSASGDAVPRTPEQIEAARKRFFDFIDAVIKNEGMTDIAWVEKALSVRVVPNREQFALHSGYQLFASGAPDDVVFQGFAGFAKTINGEIVEHRINFNLSDPELLCITVEEVRKGYGPGAESRSAHADLFANQFQQKVFTLSYTIKREKLQVQFGFDFYYRRCLGHMYLFIRS